ncbi:uncharacterized protein N7482_004638 [Penicillium canariense]|uniref:Uncharacterized protein n=1 Tax=Penicillium canariense TaxID=189055 RepID=A0A9W9LPK2_9EURO|nr:uncharacterized protein N7482_004638 [Penicillium canariense]KAJ5169044.1 hypothetical protein N7482_004638 [Penicillium canariense]
MGDAGAFIPIGWTGLTGLETHVSREQELRSSGPGIGAPAPAHLTRTLYLPHHDESTSHFPVFDVSAQYTESIKQRAMGTASYVVALGRMPRPQATDGGPATVVYNVNLEDAMENNAEGLNLTSVAPSPSAQSPVPANVTIESAEDKAAMFTMKRQAEDAVESTENTPIPVSISYPIPPTTFRKKVYVYPYFTFQIPGEVDASFEWQIHPVSHGRLRYTLVRVPQTQSTVGSATPTVPSDRDMLAIYHHVGDTISFPLPFSEGVLLLSSDMNPETEAIVVASALGFLWQLRRLSNPAGPNGKTSKKGPFGFIKGLLDRE